MEVYFMKKQTIFTESELKEKYDIILGLIKDLQNNNDYVHQAFSNLEKIPNNAIAGDIASQSKAISVQEIVKKKEDTNQKLLDIYYKMYEDLKNVIFFEEESDVEELDILDKSDILESESKK